MRGRSGEFSILSGALIAGMSCLCVSCAKFGGSALTHYDQALSEYQGGQPEQAAREMKRGASGAIPYKDIQEYQRTQNYKEMSSLRELARQNADYAANLSRSGKKDDAKDLCDLNEKMGNQLQRDSHGDIIVTLVGKSIKKSAAECRDTVK